MFHGADVATEPGFIDANDSVSAKPAVASPNRKPRQGNEKLTLGLNREKNERYSEQTVGPLLEQICGKEWNYLTVLDLRNAHLNDHHMKQLFFREGSKCKCAPKPHNSAIMLERLDLSGNNIGIEGAGLLGAFLATCSNLWFLDLSENFLIGDEGIQALFLSHECEGKENISRSSLWGISLRNTGMTDDGARLVSSLMIEPMHSVRDHRERRSVQNATLSDLQTLDLSNNMIGPFGVAEIAKNLSKSKLRELLLYSNPIHDAGALEFQRILLDTRKTISLERLGLDVATISPTLRSQVLELLPSSFAARSFSSSMTKNRSLWIEEDSLSSCTSISLDSSPSNSERSTTCYEEDEIEKKEAPCSFLLSGLLYFFEKESPEKRNIIS